MNYNINIFKIFKIYDDKIKKNLRWIKNNLYYKLFLFSFTLFIKNLLFLFIFYLLME